MINRKFIQTTTSFIVAVFATSTLLLFFQNCSPTPLQNQIDNGSNEAPDLSYFRYNYSSKPKLYANLALVFPKESVGNFAKFQVYGMLTPADGTFGFITYSVAITDENNQSICAGDAGVLDPDKQNIIFECLANPNTTEARVKLVASYNGGEEIFTSAFSK